EGVPTWSPDGHVIDAPDAERRLLQLNGKNVSRSDIELRKFVGVLASGGLVYTASPDPRNTQVWVSRTDATHEMISPASGVFDAEVGGDTIVVYGTTLEDKPHYAAVVWW